MRAAGGSVETREMRLAARIARHRLWRGCATFCGSHASWTQQLQAGGARCRSNELYRTKLNGHALGALHDGTHVLHDLACAARVALTWTRMPELSFRSGIRHLGMVTHELPCASTFTLTRCGSNTSTSRRSSSGQSSTLTLTELHLKTAKANSSLSGGSMPSATATFQRKRRRKNATPSRQTGAPCRSREA